MTLIIPPSLAATCRGNVERSGWLARLPDVVNDLQHRWSMTIRSPFNDEEGSCAWVAPVVLTSAVDAVLKIGMPHLEGAQEIAGLRFWDGRGTVRLLNADETLNAMLLERCAPGTPLRLLPEPEQDVVIARLLPQLWQSPPSDPHFRPLSSMLDYWAEETLAAAALWPDPALVQTGLELLRELANTAEQQVLLFTDLHAGNVLRAERAEWLAIDPKPFVGDAAYDATQHLINCRDRMRTAPLETINAFADIVGLSRERVRLWMFARAAAEPRSDWTHDVWTGIARQIAP